jgi:starvation-inducible DNA-binding protein
MAHFWRTQEYQGEVAQGVEEDANLIAEHIVQLGGMADGTAQVVARRTALDAYWLSAALTAFGRHVRYASEQASELQGADTAALFAEIARGIDTWLWVVQTSRQAGS